MLYIILSYQHSLYNNSELLQYDYFGVKKEPECDFFIALYTD